MFRHDPIAMQWCSVNTNLSADIRQPLPLRTVNLQMPSCIAFFVNTCLILPCVLEVWGAPILSQSVGREILCSKTKKCMIIKWSRIRLFTAWIRYFFNQIGHFFLPAPEEKGTFSILKIWKFSLDGSGRKKSMFILRIRKFPLKKLWLKKKKFRSNYRIVSYFTSAIKVGSGSGNLWAEHWNTLFSPSSLAAFSSSINFLILVS